jgi:hypothetical protein
VQGFKFQGFKVSTFQGFKVSTFQGFRVSEFQEVQFVVLFEVVILSGAALQAKRRISSFPDLPRKPDCTMTKFQRIQSFNAAQPVFETLRL